MKRKIEEVLIKIGAPCGSLGFKYITDTILLLDTDEWKNPKYMALYYFIAKKNNTTDIRVERAIRYCFKKVRDKTQKHFDYELVDHYIGFTNCENSNSLARLYYRIKSEMEDEGQK